MQTLAASIFVFGLLILAHELGHFFAARATGVKVLELAIGFGPRIVGWEKNDTSYSLRVFPLGGYCRMLGEDPDDELSKDSFIQKTVAQRSLVLLAGAVMNLVLALVLFFIIFFFLVGSPLTGNSRLGSVSPASPAGEAGLKPGDEIIKIDGKEINNWDDVVANIENRAGEELEIVVNRNQENLTLTAVPVKNPQTGKAIIGITPVVKKYYLAGSIQTSLSRFALIILSIGQVISGKAPLDVAGPVGIIMIVGEVAATGFVNLLWLAALISISLGIINLLPVPALDGGRLLFLIIEGIRGKPLDPEKEGFIHFIGFALLLLLILFVTYHDLIRWDLIPK
ncbi:MAG TPA: RIP metalloprotease RseP [Firmicutes bacterium]|nr:RIP metalloprotease RseP [Bacillota bacterium]